MKSLEIDVVDVVDGEFKLHTTQKGKWKIGVS